LPAALVVTGVLVTIADGAYAAAEGQVFSWGPIRLGWIAAALVVAGIALAARRGFGSDGEG
jgi:hypothetical protein